MGTADVTPQHHPAYRDTARRFRLSAPDSIEIEQAALITAKMKITATHSYQLARERHWAAPAGANSRQVPTHTRYAELLPANVRSLIKSPPFFTLIVCSFLDFWGRRRRLRPFERARSNQRCGLLRNAQSAR